MSERFFLYLIDDGDWHRLEDVAEELGISAERVRDAAEYLSKGHFINYDKDKGEVRVQEWVRKFPRGEWEKPGKKSFGSAVLSKNGGTVTIQETCIHNNTESDLEVNFLVVDEKLKEILINKLKET